ncbi:cell division protein FtsA [Candidatus Woesebacteria bacterium RIFCSPHIGHO2_01_FULL_39_28]|uniref:Cell division protein FtsA n=1 Tax=Candidatus Woesebacteria bacterium RIFCSPHIGHO2_01_FULL_39_28 TaxID=1802496 RepID=A0A1F7YC52_9BACT|nr:MAG: cell division protein FtsA [Candidatus Woesebacteria bacterium RIFCSPHIGHO2_01_FULL_39_28]OGM58028.1 MAG: cell division protein FtsA [Candidatus Woesebacteria bacterium RIFCSPLOWO2_01_FULL_38_20]
MNKNKIVAAIDIGSSKIATLIAQVATDPASLENNINIVGANSVESKGVKKGQIVDIEEAVEACVLSVEAAERMAGYNLDSAFISVGGAHVTSQNSHGVVAVSNPDGEVTNEDVERVINAAKAVSLPSSREVIHVIPREFIVDGEAGVRDPVGMSGVRLEVETHIVTASSSALKNLSKAVNEVGINIEEIVFNGLASSVSTVSPTEKELGAVLIDIGGGVTSFAAFIDGALSYSGAIPIGAKNVTNDLAIGLRVSLDSAEKIKIMLSKKSKGKSEDESDVIDINEFGLTEAKKISKKTLLEGIIKPRLNEIFTMVRLQLDKAGIGSRIPSGVIITGGGALTAGVSESARRMLALPVRVAEPEGVSGLIDDVLTPPFASVVGLILYAGRHPQAAQKSIIGKKFKIQGKGLIGKVFNLVKDLLP